MSEKLIAEEALLSKWRNLTPDRKQQVIDFVEFLELKQPSPTSISTNAPTPKTSLGAKLQQIRQKIVASGVPLLTDEEIEREVRERRGGYQE
jgi:hypothetical protein